ncbi:hypothetical protein, partial [Escherichia coli]|uniref:hypothetical protein n=1 Tax=Escherichia coli TaxID=562 RepID=UPI00254312D2
KTPSYTKSVSWQHHLIFDIGFINSFNQYISNDYNYTFLLFCVMMLPLLAFYRLVYIFWAGMMPAFFMPSLMCA